MITERQKAFRQQYRSRIVGWYDGYIHILIIYAMGAAAFYIYVAHIHNVTRLEWLTLPLTFLFTNIFEWAVHRFIMHRPVNIKALRVIYERHTLNHHQFSPRVAIDARRLRIRSCQQRHPCLEPGALQNAALQHAH